MCVFRAVFGPFPSVDAWCAHGKVAWQYNIMVTLKMIYM